MFSLICDHQMGFGYIFWATPTVESKSLRLELFDFVKGTPVDVAHSKMEPLIVL